MLKIEIDERNGIAVFSPDAKLSEVDFKSAAGVIDPYIEKNGRLNGLIISTQSFPGWESFAALLSHLRFVKEHHRKIAFVAFLTDSPVGSLAQRAASHFVSARVKTFKYGELASAKQWIIEAGGSQSVAKP